MSDVPYELRDICGNLDVTYFGAGGVKLGFWSDGNYHALTLELKDLEQMTKKANDHMWAYQLNRPEVD